MSVTTPQSLETNNQYRIASKQPLGRQYTRMAVCLAIGMSTTIIGTLLVGPTIAFLSIIPFVVMIIGFAMRDSVLAVCLYFGYIAMEGMYKYLSGFSQAVYIIAPLLLAVTLVGWRMSILIKRCKVAKAPFGWLIGTFLLWGVLEVFNPHSPDIISGFATLYLWYAGPIALYIVGCNAMKSSKHVMTFCYALMAVCTVVSAFAVLQFGMGHSWTQSHLPGYATINQTDWFVVDTTGMVKTGSFRPASTTDMGGGGAVWSQIGVAISLGLIFTVGASARQRTWLAFCLLINFVGLLVAGVRLWVFVGVFDSLLLILLLARSPRELIRSLGFLILTAIVAGIAFAGAQALSGGIIAQRYTETARNPFAKFQQDRGNNLSGFFNFTQSHPLGVGYQQGLGRAEIGATGRSDDPAVKMVNGETQWGKISGDMGIPGLVLLVIIMAALLINGWRCFRRLRSRQLRTIGAMLLAFLAGYVPACFGGPALQSSVQFWFVAGILAGLPTIDKREINAERHEVGSW